MGLDHIIIQGTTGHSIEVYLVGRDHLIPYGILISQYHCCYIKLPGSTS